MHAQTGGAPCTLLIRQEDPGSPDEKVNGCRRRRATSARAMRRDPVCFGTLTPCRRSRGKRAIESSRMPSSPIGPTSHERAIRTAPGCRNGRATVNDGRVLHLDETIRDARTRSGRATRRSTHTCRKREVGRILIALVAPSRAGSARRAARTPRCPPSPMPRSAPMTCPPH